MTTKDKIRKLHKQGFTSAEIATRCDCAVRYVCVTLWQDRHPGYGARWMREHRKNPRVRESEAHQQREYDRRMYADPKTRKHILARIRAWRHANPEKVQEYNRRSRQRQAELNA